MDRKTEASFQYPKTGDNPNVYQNISIRMEIQIIKQLHKGILPSNYIEHLLHTTGINHTYIMVSERSQTQRILTI